MANGSYTYKEQVARNVALMEGLDAKLDSLIEVTTVRLNSHSERISRMEGLHKFYQGGAAIVSIAAIGISTIIFKLFPG